MLGRLDLQTESAGSKRKILYRTMVRVYVLLLTQNYTLLYFQVPHIQHQNHQWQLAQRSPVQVCTLHVYVSIGTRKLLAGAACLIIIITSTHAGGSTFDLPDLSPCFPYLSAEKCKMAEEEFCYYLSNLDRHTSKVKSAFARVVLDLQRDIEENSSLKVVINCLKAYDKSLVEKLLSDCPSTGDFFDKILDHISFFDFEIIKILTRIGSKRIQKQYKKYTAMFKEYSKRRVVECPSDAFGDSEISEKVYILKTDDIIDLLTTEELKRLCNEIKATLKLPRLLQVINGCVQLTFRGFEEEDFCINEEQQQALRNAGILSISYGDQVVDISQYIKIKSETSFGE